jgi:CheY-like chemotaxis protein
MSYKILTVDDSRTIRMIVKKAFKPYDCTLVEAENGMEGLAAATKEKPDLIVLDITMPVMTGIEMLGKLLEQEDLKHIPVIMLTAESGKDNVMQIVKMGVKDYMVKPFRGEQLIERASAILNLKKRVDAPSILEDDAGPDFFFSGRPVCHSGRAVQNFAHRSGPGGRILEAKDRPDEILRHLQNDCRYLQGRRSQHVGNPADYRGGQQLCPRQNTLATGGFRKPGRDAENVSGDRIHRHPAIP